MQRMVGSILVSHIYPGYLSIVSKIWVNIKLLRRGANMTHPSVPGIVELSDAHVKTNAECKCTRKDGTNEHA